MKTAKQISTDYLSSFNMRTELLNDLDLEELARMIKEGNTSGWIDDGEGKHIYWELKVNVWKD